MHINMHATVSRYRFFFVEIFNRFTQKQCQFKKSSKIVMKKLGYVIYITQVCTELLSEYTRSIDPHLAPVIDKTPR